MSTDKIFTNIEMWLEGNWFCPIWQVSRLFSRGLKSAMNCTQIWIFRSSITHQAYQSLCCVVQVKHQWLHVALILLYLTSPYSSPCSTCSFSVFALYTRIVKLVAAKTFTLVQTLGHCDAVVNSISHLHVYGCR